MRHVEAKNKIQAFGFLKKVTQIWIKWKGQVRASRRIREYMVKRFGKPVPVVIQIFWSSAVESWDLPGLLMLNWKGGSAGNLALSQYITILCLLACRPNSKAGGVNRSTFPLFLPSLILVWLYCVLTENILTSSTEGIFPTTPHPWKIPIKLDTFLQIFWSYRTPTVQEIAFLSVGGVWEVSKIFTPWLGSRANYSIFDKFIIFKFQICMPCMSFSYFFFLFDPFN